MNKRFFSLLLALFLSCGPVVAHMEPIKKDGKYYYSAEDTHIHIDLYKAMGFLGRKIFSPTQWIKGISSLFYPSGEEKIDVNALLNPMQAAPEFHSIEPKVTWVGHASFLIQVNGFNLLTDPIFANVMLGPIPITKRAMAPGVAFDDLPRIDAILISHNHSDHTDAYSLSALAQKDDPIVFVPEGNGRLFKGFGFSRVIEQTWWNKKKLIKNGRELILGCLPAYHWSIRFSLMSYRESLWSSWMISTNADQEGFTKDTHIYFAGDTAYGPHFKEIQDEYGEIDLALMPIGPTSEGENPHPESHVDAPQAVKAFVELGAKRFIPMHYGTFFLSHDTLTYPLKRLHETWQSYCGQGLMAGKELLVPKCGEEIKVCG